MNNSWYSALTVANVIMFLSSTPPPRGTVYFFWLFCLRSNLFFWEGRGKRIIYLFVCLSFLTLTKQSQTEEWLCYLLSHSHTWMNVKANAPKRWDLIMCHLYGFCVTEEKKWNTFRWIIALVNNGRFPVLHSIMVRMGSACFITER